MHVAVVQPAWSRTKGRTGAMTVDTPLAGPAARKPGSPPAADESPTPYHRAPARENLSSKRTSEWSTGGEQGG